MQPPDAAATPPAARLRLRPRVWIVGSVLALLLAAAYASTLRVLWACWSHNPNYSHGFLIPPVSAFLLWRKRDALGAAPAAPSSWGLPVLGLGLLMHVAGTKGDLTMVQGHSLIVVLLGLVLHFFGTAVARIALFPLGYLVFMSPFPPVFADELSFRLKQWVIHASLAAAGGIGIPVARDGMKLHLTTGTVSIEDPCSGLRSLIAILALGTVLAYFSRGGAVRRSLLVLSAIPVAVAANWVRITTIVLASNFISIEVGTGIVHDVSGYLLFAVNVAGLMVSKAVLRC